MVQYEEAAIVPQYPMIPLSRRRKTEQKKLGTNPNRWWRTWRILFILLLSARTIRWQPTTSSSTHRRLEWSITSNNSLMPAIHEKITLNESFSTAMPENPQIYVIHIGKAGGTTLINSLQLGRVQSRQIKCRMKNTTSIGEDDDSCFNFLPRDSQLARHTIGYFHMWGVDRSNAERRGCCRAQMFFYLPLEIRLIGLYQRTTITEIITAMRQSIHSIKHSIQNAFLEDLML